MGVKKVEKAERDRDQPKVPNRPKHREQRSQNHPNQRNQHRLLLSVIQKAHARMDIWTSRTVIRTGGHAEPIAKVANIAQAALDAQAVVHASLLILVKAFHRRLRRPPLYLPAKTLG